MSIPASGANRGPFEARYFDGRSAIEQQVTVELTDRGLLIHRAETVPVVWSFASINQTQGEFDNEPVRLEYPSASGFANEALVFAPGVRITEAIRSFGAQASRGLAWWQWHFTPATLASGLAGIAALALLMYFFGLPWIASIAAAFVPRSWEENFGRQVSLSMVPESEDCNDELQQQAVDRIVARLSDGDRSGYHYQVRVVKNPVVNAFAAPGGSIVVFSGLMELTATPEELAGVLAHEMEHVHLRHSTKGMIRALGLSVLFSIMFGNSGGQVTSLAQTLGSLQYQRADEAAADSNGMLRIEQTRVNPKGMIHFFEKMEKPDKAPEFIRYVSSHPLTKDRIGALSKLAAEANYEPLPIVVGVPWDQVAHVCSARKK